MIIKIANLIENTEVKVHDRNTSYLTDKVFLFSNHISHSQLSILRKCSIIEHRHLNDNIAKIPEQLNDAQQIIAQKNLQATFRK